MNDFADIYGCRPNTEAPELLEEIERLAAPWDGIEKPPIVKWDSIRPHLEISALHFDKKREQEKFLYFWEIAKELGFQIEDLFYSSQGSIGSCEGFSLYQNAYLATLLKQIAAGSEQTVEKVNALVTWLYSKGWSRLGGQTISAGAKYGAEIGVFPESKVGRYSASWYDKDRAETAKEEAAKRQICTSLIPDDVDKLEAVTLCLRANHVVQIGCSQAIRGSHIDEKGRAVGELGGWWSHAILISELDVDQETGEKMFRIENSHGNIYPNRDGSPQFGFWVSEKDMKRILDGGFADLLLVVYVESPTDPKASKNLNPPEVQNAG